MPTFTGAMCNDPEYVADHLQALHDRLTDLEATVKEPCTMPNAHVIAEAPNLVCALEGMLEWARRVTQPNPGQEIQHAVTALAKATKGA